MEWIPFRLIVHKDVLEDSLMTQVEKGFYIIDFKLPQETSNSVILVSSNNPPDERDLDYAKLKCYEHFVLNNWEELEKIGELDKESIDE